MRRLITNGSLLLNRVYENPPIEDQFEVRELRTSISALDQKSLDNLGASLRGVGLEASIFLVDNTWYARPVGYEGILLPLMLPSSIEAELRTGSSYFIHGEVKHSTRGFPNRIYARKIRKLP